MCSSPQPVRRFLVLAGFVLLLMLSGCERETGERHRLDFDDVLSDEVLYAKGYAATETRGGYVFGFDLRSSPQEDARQYLPFLKYLEAATGYRFRLHFTPVSSSIADELGSGGVDFAAIGAVSLIRAEAQYEAIPMVRGRNMQAQDVYRSAIVVAPGSDITRLEQLRGKRFAFGHVDSTQGHIIPRIMLGEAGIERRDFADYRYTGSHRNCANAVVARRADACGMQDTMARALSEQGLVRILIMSEAFPSSGIAAGRHVAPEVVERVRAALLAFDPQGRHAAGLHHWYLTEMPRGFVAAADDDYEELREWMNRLGLSAPVEAPREEAVQQ